MKITPHIERLILEALPLGRHESAPVQAELARLLIADGLDTIWEGGAVPPLRADTLHLALQNDATALRTRLAQTIYGSLNP